MSKNIVQCDTLGKNGRFANSIIQYLFAKAWARETNSVLECNQDWVGFKIFDIKENPISCVLPKTKVDEFPSSSNINLYGYWQHSKCMSLVSKQDLKNWLPYNQFSLDVLEEVKKMVPKKYACAHIRAGDYKSKYNHMYCLPTLKSYMDAHKKYSPELPLNFVAEEMGFRLSRLDGTELDFLPDFFAMTNADVLYRANSTFSWLAACMAIKQDAKVYSPRVGSLVGENYVEFVPGNKEMFMNPIRFGTNHDEIDIV